MIATKKIRDPIHGFIHFSDAEKEIIDSRHFQRLRGIKQLALTCLIYPGAMHTRFEHSLGVMEMASRAFDLLRAKRRNEQLLKRNFKSIGMGIDEARQLLRLTALFHDTGHLPFSHAAENILPEHKGHEAVSVAIVEFDERNLNKRFYRGISNQISVLIQKNGLVPPELLILKKLISSQLDVDRADYLLRDSHHCGVEYGNFDYPRLFEMLSVIEGREGGLELAIDRGGVHSLEALILARYYMFAQVYFHRVRRIFDLYLAQYMKVWAKTTLKHLMDVIRYDDQDLHAKLLADSGKMKADQGKLASRIINRKHHRAIFETGDCAEAADKRDIGNLFEQLKGKFPSGDFILDMGASGTIHKFYVPGDEELGEEFSVLSPYGPRPLTKESIVIAKLPKRFAVYRVYSEGNPTNLSRYKIFARRAWQELTQGR